MTPKLHAYNTLTKSICNTYILMFPIIHSKTSGIQWRGVGLYLIRRFYGKCIESEVFKLQSTLVISNSKGLTEILRDIRTSTYQS